MVVSLSICRSWKERCGRTGGNIVNHSEYVVECTCCVQDLDDAWLSFQLLDECECPPDYVNLLSRYSQDPNVRVRRKVLHY